jgi:hypothetical protein
MYNENSSTLNDSIELTSNNRSTIDQSIDSVIKSINSSNDESPKSVKQNSASKSNNSQSSKSFEEIGEKNCSKSDIDKFRSLLKVFNEDLDYFTNKKASNLSEQEKDRLKSSLKEIKNKLEIVKANFSIRPDANESNDSELDIFGKG